MATKKKTSKPDELLKELKSIVKQSDDLLADFEAKLKKLAKQRQQAFDSIGKKMDEEKIRQILKSLR